MAGKPKNNGTLLAVRVSDKCHQEVLDIRKYMALWYRPSDRTNGKAVELAVAVCADWLGQATQEELKKLFAEDKEAGNA